MFELRDGDKIVGRFSGDQVQSLAQEGKLHIAMEVRQLPSGEWTPLSRVKGLQLRSATPHVSAAQHPSAGRTSNARPPAPPSRLSPEPARTFAGEAWAGKDQQVEQLERDVHELTERLADAEVRIRALEETRQEEILSDKCDVERQAKQVRNWKGRGTKNTEVFQVATRDWVIAWDSSADFFSVTVYDANGEIVDVAASVEGQDQDSTVMHCGPGTFYLDIDGDGPWAVRVTDV